jgi:hypothetical protein
VVVDRDDPGRTGRQCLVHLLADPRGDALACDLPDDAARGRTDHGRREQRRREQTDHETHSSAGLHALPPHVVAGLLHCDLTVGVLGDEREAIAQ